ncbi:PrpF domain-containing protein [Streptomyces sp. ODS28]|uniref:PrpF domain-containing protein n=1 Tax=Streptomyces sp. ODS28 TaxID=3136688 RepID=UPI0031EC2563
MRIPATLVRGGTSKCWLFSQVHTPADRAGIERLLVAAYDAADPVQLDGVGGATPTTSKAAVVGASPRAGVDIDYLFAQVGIGTGVVEWGSNCGNCATAIALYAVAKGLVPITGDRTRVVMHNANTGALLEAVVDTTGRRVHEFGEQTVPGTRSGGVGVGLTFLDPAGGTTGKLLPTGTASELLPAPGELPTSALRSADARSLRVSCVDAGAPVVLVDAASADRTGAEPLDRVRADVPWLRAVRHAAAARMGLQMQGSTDGAALAREEAPAPSDAVPKVGLVGPPASYTSTLGEHIAAEDHELTVRMLSMNAPHPAIGLTSAVAIAAAELVRDTVVAAASSRTGEWLRIGTPAGVVPVRCTEHTPSGPGRVTVQRAARILAEAELSVPEPLAPAAA